METEHIQKENEVDKKEKKVNLQKSDKEKLIRVFGFDTKEVSADNRTVSLAFSSEEP
jgi:hypothetical protein